MANVTDNGTCIIENQIWEIMGEDGYKALMTVDGSGNFTATGWAGEAPGCDDYEIPIENGLLDGDSMSFSISNSFCDGAATIIGNCGGNLNQSYPDGDSALGTCSGTISAPVIGTTEFTFTWTAVRTYGVQTKTTMTWNVTDNCSDGQVTHIRFFDFANNWRWPAPPNYWILEQQGLAYEMRLECFEGYRVCFGAASEGGDREWGVALDGATRCPDCCQYCDGGSYARSLTCNN